jgi:hypothetical protein
MPDSGFRRFTRAHSLFQAAALRSVALAAPLLFSRPAAAYPYFVGLRQIDCGGCHYSPTGGGLINDWGRSTRAVTWGGTGDGLPHGDARGFDDAGAATLQADVGADARVLALVPLNTNVGSPALLVPMLLELEGVAAYGPLEAYASVTPRPGTPGAPYLVFSREHWLLLRVADQATLRVGRVVLPFGLRLPDHTQYVREDFGFDPWGQSYALELDLTRDNAALSAAAFAGDLTSVPSARQERGGVLRASFALGEDRGFVGGALLGAQSEARSRAAGSLFTGLRPFDRCYLLAELAAQRIASGHNSSLLDTGAAFLRLGWFLTDAVDLYAEGGVRGVVDQHELTQVRASVGSNWQLTSWAEVIPTFQIEHQSGRGSELVLLGQLHLTL